MRALAVSLATICSVGCAGAPPSDEIIFAPCSALYLEAAAGTLEAERQSLEAASAMWRAVGISSLTDAAGAESTPIPVLFREAPDAFHGIYEPSRGEIVINRRLEGVARDITVAHELGHALGLPHIEPKERISVMNPGNTAQLPDEKDAEALAAQWSECLTVPR